MDERQGSINRKVSELCVQTHVNERFAKLQAEGFSRFSLHFASRRMILTCRAVEQRAPCSRKARNQHAVEPIFGCFTRLSRSSSSKVLSKA
jgi:hypothetical protein